MTALHLVCFERRPRPSLPGTGDHLARSGNEPGTFDAAEVGRPGARRLGALVREGPRSGDVVDLNRALAAMLALEDVGAPEAEADSLVPADPLAFLRGFARGRGPAEEALAFVLDSLSRYDTPDLQRAGILEERRRVHLCAPVPRPGKLVAVARNYADHAAERGARERPVEPVLFVKASSSVIGPGDDVVLPAASDQVDYEGELAVVIARPLREASEADALACVAGYTVANDITARDFQHTRGQYFLGKSCDTFCPLGPVLLTADGVSDPQDLELRTRLCGEVVQGARTKEMLFGVAEILAFASRLLTLEPGDVVLTGTPAGVGAAKDPPRYLRDGDVVEVEIERIGCLRNPVVGPRAGGRGA